MAESNLSLVLVEQQNPTEPLADSRAIAKELGVKHSNWIQNVVIKYQSRLEKWGLISFKKRKIKSKGRPEVYCLLNERQILYCLTLSRNNEIVLDLKERLVDEFDRLKKIAQQAQIEIEVQKRLPVWQEERKKSKLANKRLGDAVYEFIQWNMMSYRRRDNMYTVVATASSKAIVGCAPWIYRKQKMVDNFRDALDETQLMQLELIENLAAHLIETQNVYPKNAIEQAAVIVKPSSLTLEPANNGTN